MTLKNKKVLVTGAGGFIGSHLSERLVEQGCKVKSFVRYNSRNFWGWLDTSPYKEKMEIVAGDIRDYDSVRDAMRNIDVVFHLAALIGIPYSYISPLAYVKTNLEGTYNVLQAARDLGVEKIIHTSTSEVYGTAQFVPITEEHPINPQSPYAATKAGADYLALSFYRSFDLPVSIIRPFNNYGPRQSARAITPTIITQMLAGEKEIKLGSIHPTRDLTYVKDTVEAFLTAEETDDSVGEVVNIGRDSEISVKDLANLIAKLLKIEVEISIEAERIRPEKSEVKKLRSDIKKAKELLKWSPKYSLEAGLQETIAWIKRNLAQYKSEIYNV